MQALTAFSASAPCASSSPIDHRAGAAVAFRAAFLGAGAMQIFAQMLKHSARARARAHLAHGALVIKADGLRCHGESGKTVRTGRALRMKSGRQSRPRARRSPSSSRR